MKKLDYKEMARRFNDVRQESGNKSFLRSEIFNLLKEKGFNEGVINEFLRRGFIYNKHLSKRDYLYFFKQVKETGGQFSLYYKELEDCYRRLGKMKSKSRSSRKENQTVSSIPAQSPEQSSVELLKKENYKIFRLKGFNEEEFKKDYPELYKKYLIYEEV